MAQFEKSPKGDYYITSYQGRILSALCQDDKLVQASFSSEKLLQDAYEDCHSKSRRFPVGAVVIGRVLNKVDNIQAAFVELAPGVKGYLPYANITTDQFNQGDVILVQVIKDAVKTKDPVLSMDISLSGKYVVINCQKHKLLFSKKASQKQTERFKRLIGEAVNEYHYGVILRTNAMLLTDPEILFQELDTLCRKMDYILAYAKDRTVYSIMAMPPSPYIEKLRDTYGLDYQRILTDDGRIYEEVKAYLETYAPDELDKLTLFQGKSMSLLNFYKLGEKIDTALSKNVWLKNGGYLVIEPTESLTAIDVNTGKYIGKGDKEQSFYHVNMEAAKEIAAQLRVRNLSGMILVDFINMKEDAHNAELLDTLRKLTADDPVPTSVIDITPLGLVEITRKKINKTLREQYYEAGTSE